MTVSSLPARPQLFASSRKLAGVVSVSGSGLATKSSQTRSPTRWMEFPQAFARKLPTDSPAIDYWLFFLNNVSKLCSLFISGPKLDSQFLLGFAGRISPAFFDVLQSSLDVLYCFRTQFFIPAEIFYQPLYNNVSARSVLGSTCITILPNAKSFF